MTSRQRVEASVRKVIPRFVKVLVVVQSLIILFLSFWVVEEYLNNAYFQVYVNSYLHGGSFSAIILISTSLLATVAGGLYAKLRNTRREHERILSSEKVGPDGSRLGQPLDTRTEQHLIEMIRKTQPIINSGSGTSGDMPPLRQTEEQGSN
jgi:hypothetical protein